MGEAIALVRLIWAFLSALFCPVLSVLLSWKGRRRLVGLEKVVPYCDNEFQTKTAETDELVAGEKSFLARKSRALEKKRESSSSRPLKRAREIGGGREREREREKGEGKNGGPVD